MDSSDSLSPPSEPVDIGKWFSSYVYESPELNTIEDFKDSGVSVVAETEESPNEREQNLDGNIDLVLDGKGISDFVFNCKNSIRDENYKREELESSDSLSLCSEPPDIKKWFSSYVYDSPILDTSLEFRSDHEENEAHEQESDAKSGSKEKEVTLSNSKRNGKDDLEVENIPADGLSECIDFVEDSENEDSYFPEDSQKANVNQKSAALSDLTTEWDMEQCLQKKSMQQQQGNDSAKDFVFVGSFLENLSSEFNSKASYDNLNVRKRWELDQESVITKDPSEESSKAEDFANGGSIFDEQNSTEFAEDGFISTRKSRCRKGDKENSFRRLFDPMKEGIAMGRRKVLSETTNIVQPCNSIGITGKWRCPQKTKPNLGPPLKQLRLEKWFHRA